MPTRVRLALVLVALGCYVVGGIALLGLGFWSSLAGEEREVVGDALRGQVGFLVVAGVLHALVLGVVVAVFFGRYLTATRRAAADTRIAAVANPDHRLVPSGPPEIRDLAVAVNLLADRVAVGALDDARSAIEHERNRLAAVVSQLRIGVIVGNAEGLVLLYNDAARAQVDDQAALGLGRSLLAVVDPALVNAAVPAGTAERAGVHVTAVRAGDGALDGFVVTFDDQDAATRNGDGQAAARPRPVGGSTSALTYDFALTAAAGAGLDGGRRLDELAYTVLDTETTGMNPSAGDAIVAIGAVHVVNGRVLERETFDRLVDPRRAVSPASTAVHGISGDMLAGQPTIDEVLPELAAFAAGTVLVGHNVDFDLRFLEVAHEHDGGWMDQPALDTLLLSAALHPDAPEHRLDAVAQRLGVPVLGRHTALGDALVTAEVFLRLLRLLAARGVHTLDEARELTARTKHARASSGGYTRDTSRGAPDTTDLPAL